MGFLRGTRTKASEQGGAVLVMFAVFASVVTLLLAFVLDVGNWFEHQRHLQLQADAAATAAGEVLTYPCSSSAKEQVYQEAGQYGGVRNVITPEGSVAVPEKTELYNQQIGSEHKGNVHEEVNEKAFYGQKFEGHADETLAQEAPCEAESGVVDVKMTETELPWFFKAINVPYINAHARVSIKAETTASAVEPLIESEPVEVRAFFVNDEPDGSDSNYKDQTLATAALTNIGSNEEKGTIKWTNASNPVAVAITKPHIGVRIALAGSASGKPEGLLTGAGNETDEVCTHVYVECFDEDTGVVPPLLNISGYTMEGEGKAEPTFAPIAHKVTLSTPEPDTCTDAYFSTSNTEINSTCTLTISAELKYGADSAKETGVTVTPEFVYTEGFGFKKEKVKEPAMKLEGGVWTDEKAPAKLPSYFYGNFGSTEVNLVVACTKETGSPCEKTKNETTTLSDVQRAFSSGPDGSNRIVGAKVFEPGAATPVPGEKDADAFEICETADKEECTHKLAVTIELKGSLEDAKKYFNKESAPHCATEEISSSPECHVIPPFRVTYADNDQESDDQFVLSCPPTTSKTGLVANYETALSVGCTGKYSVNTHGGSCTTEKAGNEKVAAEEKAEKEQHEKEEAAKTKREKEEAEAVKAREAREAKEKTEREKWATEEKETKITKAEREAKEKTQETARKADETTEANNIKAWEAEEKAKRINHKEVETKEKAQEAEKKARVTKEAEERTKWAAEEKELKVTEAQRKTKEKEQTTTREADEKAERTAREKREKEEKEAVGTREKREAEEKATKEAKEKHETASHECVGLVEANGTENFKATSEGGLAEELTASFQHYLAKRIESAPNGTKYYCPNNWVNNNDGGVPSIPANDSRLVQFFVVPFTVTDFERKGEVSPLVPIVDFATFYITGWDDGNYKSGQGTGVGWNPKERRDECSEKLFYRLPAAEREELENETIPLKVREEKEKEKGFDDDTQQPREVVGHLFKYVNVLGEGSGTAKCEQESYETCEERLTE